MITLDVGNSAATTGGASSTSRESGVPQKLQRTDGRQHIPNVVPPKGRVATLTRISGGQRQVSSIIFLPKILISSGFFSSELAPLGPTDPPSLAPETIKSSPAPLSHTTCSDIVLHIGPTLPRPLPQIPPTARLLFELRIWENVLNESSFLNDTVKDSIFRAIFVLY